MTHYERDEKEQVSNRRRFHEIVARCELNVRNKEIKRTKEKRRSEISKGDAP